MQYANNYKPKPKNKALYTALKKAIKKTSVEEALKGFKTGCPVYIIKSNKK